MRALLVLLLGIIFGLFGVDTIPGMKIDIIMDGTVALVSDEHVFCAGVWISDNEILTAGHCVRDKSFVSYYDYRDFASGRFVGNRLGIVSRVSFSDLALIRVIGEDHQHSVISIYSGEITPGMEGNIIGHPAGQVYSYLRGWVSGIRHREGAYYLQISAPIWLGNSGGGIFDGRGRLMGICSSMSLAAPSVGYYVSHREILEFLEQSELQESFH